MLSRKRNPALPRRAGMMAVLLISLIANRPATQAAESTDTRGTAPNILIITLDNVGYGDLPTYNPQSAIKTPHLDQLAAEGVRLTNFYTASSTCTVSRACLLTGRVAQRHGLVNQLPGVAGNYGVGLDQRERLIPQYLKEADTPYATGCFGKWNVGFAPGSRPTERGFDEFIGHASGNIDYYRHNYRERHDLFDGTQELHRAGVYSTDLFADAAIDFITRRSQAGTPWFCYLPFNAPHFPSSGNRRDGEPNIWQAPDWALAEYGLTPDEADPTRRFHANVTALDRAIGRVLAAVDAAGCRDTTFVFCMSDNGAFDLGRKGLDVGSNAPLRSGGITCWDGGIRVPAFARWPGRIPSGTVADHLSWSPDLLATCAALAKSPLPKNIVLDGKNLLPVLTDGEPSPHQSLYFRFRSHAALRMGDWKVVRETPDAAWMLFDLSRDIGETEDLAATQDARVRELAAEFDRWEADVAASRQPVSFLSHVQSQAAALRAADQTPVSAAAWQEQQAALRQQLLDAWGGFPETPAPLEPRILATLDRDGYRIEKLIFQTFPDVWMTANAYVPTSRDAVNRRQPAVLCVHGHWRGAKQDPNVQARCVGLAKLGFFVLAVDAFGAGERAVGRALGEYHGEMSAATLLPVGRPLSGVQVYENQRAVDYLLTRPEVDGERIGITGASGGGNQTMYAGAWDNRFRAVVPVCSVGNYQAYLGAACCLCEVVPGALRFTEEWGVLSLTAPRALMVINASQDARQFSIAEAERSLAMVDPIYGHFQQPQRLRHTTFESPHAYNQPMREAMYGWMAWHLNDEGSGSPIAEPDMTLEEPETLRCYPGDTRPADWLTLPQFAAREGRRLVNAAPQPTSAAAWPAQAAALRQQLDQQVLGETSPQTKLISADLTNPKTIRFAPESGVAVTATWTEPPDGRSSGRVLIITCDGQESAPVKEAVAAVLTSGRTAISLELRATGDQAYERDRIGQAPDHNTAEWAMWIGRPLLGQWVQDVRAAVEAIHSLGDAPSTTPAPVAVVGLGAAGLVAVCAAALTEQIDQVVMVDSLASYLSDVPYKGQRLGLMAPGIVARVGDVPQLAALIAPRRLIVAGGVDGGGRSLAADELQTNFAATQTVYRLLDHPDQFLLLTHTTAEQFVRRLD